MYVHRFSMVYTALQLNAAECKRDNILQIISGENCDSNQRQDTKTRERRVKLLNLRGKTNVYRIQFLNSEIIQ